MGIENLPLIKDFENVVKNIPPKYGSKIYGFVKSFYLLGLSKGVKTGCGLESEETFFDTKTLVDYLNLKKKNLQKNTK